MNKKLIFLLALSNIVLYATRPIADMDVIWMIEQGDSASFCHELELGLDPNATIDDLSLLMLASQLGHTQIVRNLVAHEAIDLHAQDREGNTALHYAAIFDRIEVIKVLMLADAPRITKRGSRAPLLSQIKNNAGKTASDLAVSEFAQRMLINPDEYIETHPQQFREAAEWFNESCPAKAQARSARLETFGQKVERSYRRAKEVAVRATQRVGDACKRAYAKSNETIDRGYEVTQKAKKKVESKYGKVRKFFKRRYKKAKKVATRAYDATADYAHRGYEKTKSAAATGYEKTKEASAAGFERMKNAFKRAYQRVKGGN